ncbi:MAG: ABC transporter permease [Clostridia bacterium]|nr:ABC transporter permease [Clostridia bacterium]
MKSSKLKNIVKHNVEISIRNKWFVILNVLMLLISIVSFNLGNIKTVFKNQNITIGQEEKITISIDDKIGNFSENLGEEIEKANLSDKIELTIDTNEGSYTSETIPDNFINVVLDEAQETILEAKVISKEAVNANYLDVINSAIEDTRNDMIAKEYNMDEEGMELLSSAPSIERIMLSVDSTSYNESTEIIRMVLNYIIFFILIMILSATASSVAQEKNSKSIEYVLTSISAKDYLLSKVISVILLYVVQFIFTLLYILIGSYLSSIIKLSSITAQGVTLSRDNFTSLMSFVDGRMMAYLAVTFVFSLLTIFILNVIQAVLSSKTTNVTEAGNTTIILLMLNLVLYIVANFAIVPMQVPSMFIYIISCVPIVSMYFIPSMILLSHANVIQVVIATVLLIVFVPIVLKIGSKYFKQGILSTSSKNTKKNSKKNLSEEEIIQKKLQAREYSKVGYVLGFSVILYIVISILLSFISNFIQIPIYQLFGGKISEHNVSVIMTCIASCISLYIPYLFLKMYTEKAEVEKKKASIGESLVYVLMGVPIITLIQMVTTFILRKININYNVVDKLNLFDGSSILSILLFFIQIAILPAIFEELYMRKGVINYSKKYGKVFAVITSAIMFASIHLNLSQSIFALMLGLAFAYIAVKTERIFPTMLLHFINNGMSALVLIFQDNLIIVGIIGFIFLLVNFAGVIMIIIKLAFALQARKKKPKEMKEKESHGSLLQIYRYMFTDYTFIVTVVSIVIFSIYMEKMLTIL